MLRMRDRIALGLLPILVLAGCGDGARGGLGSDTLARAGEIRLGVEEAARWIAPVPDLPDDPSVVEALTEFWIDYTLLALVMNEPEALDRLDLSLLMDQEIRQEKVFRLREAVIDDDPEVTDEELLEIYETERPGERVRARHILLLFPDGSSPTQRDSVQAVAEGLRERILGGERFEALAEIYSDDDGTATRGGDLGYVPRGTMASALEAATFALEVGEVSEVVRTSFGVHILRVDEKEMPSLDEIGPQLREELKMERTAIAESTFVAGIEEPAGIRVHAEGIELARSLARTADTDLSDRAARRTLAEFEGGSYTARNYRDFLLLQPPALRHQIAEEATDEQIESLLRNQVRFHLLVAEADRLGIEIPSDEIEELDAEIRSQYRTLAELLGIAALESRDGETVVRTVERAMQELMPRLIRGDQDVYPLGNLAAPLRLHFGVRVSSPAMERAAGRITELRAEGFSGDAVSPEPGEESGT